MSTREFRIPKFQYATGVRIGGSVILSHVDGTPNRFHEGSWVLRCRCGNEYIATGSNMVVSYKKAKYSGAPLCYECRMLAIHEQCRRKNIEYMTTHKFGMLTPIEVDHVAYGSDGTSIYWWMCQCDCGNICFAREDVLRNSKVLHSCGCGRRDVHASNYKHGLSQIRLYNIYSGMVGRCYRSTCDTYRIYGGRGIEICEDWYDPNDFEKGLREFIAWAMSHGYKDPEPGSDPGSALSIERVNVDDNYCPENCSWIPLYEQARNTRFNQKFNFDVGILILTDVVNRIGMSQAYFDARHVDGWSNDAIIHSYLNPTLRMVKTDSGYRDKNGFLVLIPTVHKMPPAPIDYRKSADHIVYRNNIQ